MAQTPYEAPMSENSVPEFALRHNGKLVHFGSSIRSTTFLHLLEDRLDLPGVETALCKVKQPDGTIDFVAVPRHLPGGRDFYSGDKDTIRFFRAAVAEGLEIRETKLGTGTILTMDLRPLYEIGTKVLTADPSLFLSEDPKNLSCRRLWKKYQMSHPGK